MPPPSSFSSPFFSSTPTSLILFHLQALKFLPPAATFDAFSKCENYRVCVCARGRQVVVMLSLVKPAAGR